MVQTFNRSDPNCLKLENPSSTKQQALQTPGLPEITWVYNLRIFGLD